MILNTKKNFNFNLIYPAAVNFFRLVIGLHQNKMFERQFVILAAATKTWKKATKISVSISIRFSCLHSINSLAVELNKFMLERD